MCCCDGNRYSIRSNNHHCIDMKGMKIESTLKAIAFFAILVIMKSLLLWAVSIQEREKPFRTRLREAILLVEGTLYKLGGVSLRGVDCSGAIFLICKLAGKPIPRLSSRKMYALYGMNHHYRKSKEFDLVWWTFSPRRPYGHIGIMDGDQKHFWHASRKGFTRAVFRGGRYFDRYFETCGRIL